MHKEVSLKQLNNKHFCWKFIRRKTWLNTTLCQIFYLLNQEGSACRTEAALNALMKATSFWKTYKNFCFSLPVYCLELIMRCWNQWRISCSLNGSKTELLITKQQEQIDWVDCWVAERKKEMSRHQFNKQNETLTLFYGIYSSVWESERGFHLIKLQFSRLFKGSSVPWQ